MRFARKLNESNQKARTIMIFLKGHKTARMLQRHIAMRRALWSIKKWKHAQAMRWLFPCLLKNSSETQKKKKFTLQTIKFCDAVKNLKSFFDDEEIFPRVSLKQTYIASVSLFSTFIVKSFLKSSNIWSVISFLLFLPLSTTAWSWKALAKWWIVFVYDWKGVLFEQAFETSNTSRVENNRHF